MHTPADGAGTPRLTVVPREDPAAVRAREGFSQTSSWYSPRRQRPPVFRALHGRPEGDVRSDA